MFWSMEEIFWLASKKKKRFKNIWYHSKKIATTGQGDDYKTGCLLDYPYLKKTII